MAQEKEIKIQLKIDLIEFIKRIQIKDYKLLHSLNQTDIYFDTTDWHLYNNIAAMRLRRIDNIDNSVSFKKVFFLPKINDYYVEEIEVKFPLNDSGKLKEIFDRVNIPIDKYSFENGNELTKYLSKYGYFDEQRMLKTRRVFKNKENEVVIDDVENVGIIVELECLNDDPIQIVKTLLNDKEWIRSVEGTSYIWLKNVKGLTTHLNNIKRFEKEPNWNVWESEKEFYLSIQNDQI